ncbi:acyltransferase 3 [Fibrisoma limi BUZ 3]|uniref:Acyltransferase 3 n=1 Tax=Fibrisoma limi BUZ 3 TaxID=1185876 RepID=I2GE20_9BACT|nr:acyltransferase family protein [Fibrisoma limi]CCH52145.1 acyltransferase 3 [Fibrisoma limi BUZ 3]
MHYHSLDNLRTTMMLMGLVLHAAGPYMEAAYLPDDPIANHPFFDMMFLFIHTFRMPAFFIMSGFFSALLVERRGVVTFVKNRANRILIPFLIGYFTINILIQAAYVYCFSNYTMAPVVKWFSTGTFLLPVITPTVHLWFLYFLLIFYVGVYVAVRIKGLKATLPGHTLSRWLVSGWAIPVWIAFSALFLWFMPGATFYTPSDLTPSPIILAGLGMYFVFGWLLFQQPHWLTSIQRPAWWLLLGGLVVFVIYAIMMLQISHNTALPTTYRVDLSALSATSTWLISFGLIGLFQRYLDQPSPLSRYLAQSSYWVYIIHLLICTYVQIWLMPVAWTAFGKFAVGLAITFALSLISYDLFVRDTVVGQVLNGRRATPIWRMVLQLRRSTADTPLFLTKVRQLFR